MTTPATRYELFMSDLLGGFRAPTPLGAIGGENGSPAPSDVTLLLRQWSDGDREALDRLVPLMYDELRRLAHGRLRREGARPSLNTTALVHDAYLKLVDVRRARFEDRTHFLAMAS